jgi:hypothetical protein
MKHPATKKPTKHIRTAFDPIMRLVAHKRILLAFAVHQVQMHMTTSSNPLKPKQTAY